MAAIAALSMLAGCAGKPSQAKLDDTRQHALFARDAAAWQRLEDWARNDDPDAQRTLAEALSSDGGMAGWRKARPWYQAAAERGDALSAFRLARIYAKGLGAAADAGQSARWLALAAQRKQADAACMLGLRAKDGGDAAAARGWFELAAQQGSAEAMFQLGIAYQEGLGVAADQPRARGWYEKAARLEMPAALQTLAMAYEGGDLGLKKDPAKAAELFNLAAHAIHDFESALF
ncbi:hypothetical protein BI344_15315 [Chromobacterium sphagni]|uniref:Sel1 repeat family protein n=2 Tax=Chromobacterium sphagni TaxID=1903179 RepID=A0ABX3CCP1_9NEIS|nr:hypothetical protein BI344_15315 [Chromobacterium sphagni]